MMIGIYHPKMSYPKYIQILDLEVLLLMEILLIILIQIIIGIGVLQIGMVISRVVQYQLILAQMKVDGIMMLKELHIMFVLFVILIISLHIITL